MLLATGLYWNTVDPSLHIFISVYKAGLARWTSSVLAESISLAEYCMHVTLKVGVVTQ